MARKEKTIHYIYKTTCNVTGKWYVGMHSTTKLDDGYMGSGKILRYSIRKYGIDNHTKEILEYLETREALVLREIEIVTKELISDGLCINLKEGGTGGLSSEIHKFNFRKAGINGFIEKIKTNSEFKQIHIERTSKYIIEYNNSGKNISPRFKDKNHSEETKQLMSEKKKGIGIGETNSQFGTCWITKEGTNKKIKQEDFETYQLDGWLKGRK